jgi:hypothetical protein
MPSHRLKDEEVRELSALVQGWGKMLAEQAYGAEGPGLDVDLAGMEELAVTMQQALLKGLCEELTRRQAERLPETQPCPDCGRECPVERPDERRGGKGSSRPMRLRGGCFELEEPWCYCRHCRRSFFPSADGSAH